MYKLKFKAALAPRVFENTLSETVVDSTSERIQSNFFVGTPSMEGVDAKPVQLQQRAATPFTKWVRKSIAGPFQQQQQVFQTES